jgi:hypothetical protein
MAGRGTCTPPRGGRVRTPAGDTNAWTGGGVHMLGGGTYAWGPGEEA